MLYEIPSPCYLRPVQFSRRPGRREHDSFPDQRPVSVEHKAHKIQRPSNDSLPLLKMEPAYLVGPFQLQSEPLAEELSNQSDCPVQQFLVGGVNRDVVHVPHHDFQSQLLCDEPVQRLQEIIRQPLADVKSERNAFRKSLQA